jgi:hypothetical protein
MVRSLRIAAAVALLAALVVGSGTVAASSGRGKVFDAKFVGLAVPGTVIAGVTGAGHAWAIESGKAMIFAGNRVKVIVEGLVLTPEGTNPVANGRVVVSCNGGGTGNIVMSGPVPLSIPDGNAEFDGTLALPSPCNDPAVFFTNGTGLAWFAVATD